jgi:hypothetical protein
LRRPLLSIVLSFCLDSCQGLSAPKTQSSSSPLGLLVVVDKEQSKRNLKSTVNHVPTEFWSRQLSFQQVVTSMKVEASDLRGWDVGADLFNELDDDATTMVGSPSLISPEMVLIPWNVTWTPPSSAWLRDLGELWPGVTVEPRPYNHLFDKPSSFSWEAVGRLFSDAVRDGSLRVPLACIEGHSCLRFRKKGGESADWELCSITEELSYAIDLERNALRNQKCAEDLRLFLLLGRKPPSISWEEWEDQVAGLAWSSVPGSGPLDIVPMADEEGIPPAILFLGAASVGILAFATALAPELIGQSLFTSPSYIIQPSELNSII